MTPEDFMEIAGLILIAVLAFALVGKDSSGYRTFCRAECHNRRRFGPS